VWLDQSAAENALIEPAVRELRARRFETATTLAMEHERRFPDGALSQTRDMVLIEALLMLGERSNALERAARFRERFPDSLYRQKLDTLLLER
jgi:outer membrane protein assembly factor BamD (BamD/ComL family)